MVLSDAFVEWAHVHGQRYGTSKKMIEDRMAQGADVVLEIDYQGALQIKRMYANAVLIFILPPAGKSCVRDWSAGARMRLTSSKCASKTPRKSWPRPRNSTSL